MQARIEGGVLSCGPGVDRGLVFMVIERGGDREVGFWGAKGCGKG